MGLDQAAADANEAKWGDCLLGNAFVNAKENQRRNPLKNSPGMVPVSNADMIYRFYVWKRFSFEPQMEGSYRARQH